MCILDFSKVLIIDLKTFITVMLKMNMIIKLSCCLLKQTFWFMRLKRLMLITIFASIKKCLTLVVNTRKIQNSTTNEREK